MNQQTRRLAFFPVVAIIAGVIPALCQTQTPNAKAAASGSPMLIQNRKTPPVVIEQVDADYPEAALTSQVEGTVVLSVEISPKGAVENIGIKSGNRLLATAAIEAIKRWRFQPAVGIDGNPMRWPTQIQMSFHLLD